MLYFQTLFASGQKKATARFKWSEAAILPAPDGLNRSLGVAGPVQGVSNGVLVVAGGSNFPGKMPWNGGKKVYYNKVYILEYSSGKYTWNDKINDTLPEPISYSGCTSTEEGIVYVGGQNQNGLSDKCYLVNFDPSQNKLNFKRLPDLPFGLTNAGVTSIGSKIYIAGGDEENRSSGSLFCLDLQDKSFKWERLRDLPLALGNSVVIAQNYKAGKEIFVFGGRNKTSAGVTVFHSTVFAFDPLNNSWRKCADISDGNGRVSLAAGSGVPLNNDQILLTGGDNGKVFHEIETLNLEIEKTRDKAQKEKLIRQRNALNDHHQGFDRRLLLYSTENDEWREAGSLPFPSHVTTTDVIWNNKIVISNGEERPGVRTPVIMVGEEK